MATRFVQLKEAGSRYNPYYRPRQWALPKVGVHSLRPKKRIFMAKRAEAIAITIFMQKDAS